MQVHQDIMHGSSKQFVKKNEWNASFCLLGKKKRKASAHFFANSGAVLGGGMHDAVPLHRKKSATCLGQWHQGRGDKGQEDAEGFPLSFV